MPIADSQQQQQHVLYGDEYVSSELLSEYQTLQRQYKILQSDRRLHSQETAEISRRQSADLRRLEEENSELRSNLKAARSRSAKRERQSETQHLRELLAELDSMEDEIRRVREDHMQLDSRIREARKRVRRTRIAGGGVGTAAGAMRSLQETIVLYEKKLESRSVKYQTVVWDNAKLRESLDHLRADRQKFLAVRERLQAELLRLQKRRAQLTESATEAYRDSEDARRRIRELQDRETANAAEHAQSVKLLYREIDLHDHVGSFMRAKLQHRQTDPELRRLREELQRRQADERRQADANDDSLRQSFEIMRRRYAAVDLDDMVRHFLHAEDENFSLFRFCTARQAEVESLRREVEQLIDAIHDERQQDGNQAASRSELLADLAGRVAEVKADRLRRADRLCVVNGLLDQLVEDVAKLSSRIGVDDSRIGGSGFSIGSPKNSLLRALGSLEARVLELLAVRHRLLGDNFHEAATADRSGASGIGSRQRTRRGTELPGGAVGGSSGSLALRLPEVDEFDVEIRTAADRLMSDRPLTKEQIVEKLLNQIAL